MQFCLLVHLQSSGNHPDSITHLGPPAAAVSQPRFSTVIWIGLLSPPRQLLTLHHATAPVCPPEHRPPVPPFPRLAVRAAPPPLWGEAEDPTVLTSLCQGMGTEPVENLE